MLDPFTDKEKGGERRFDARRSVKFFLGETGEIYSLWRLRDRDTIEAYLPPRCSSGSDVDLGRFELRFSFLLAECSTGVRARENVQRDVT